MSLVSISKKGQTAIITIDNPPLNVIDLQVRSELRSCLCTVRDDEAIVSVIITGAGTKAFVAGADIKGFLDMVKKQGAAYDFVYAAYEVWFMLENLKKPTIAAINGLAMGAGCEMALCCDIIIADEKAEIGLPETKLGLFPGGGGTQRMPKLIGKNIVKELIFTGEPITAERACHIGLVNHVTPEGRVMDKALEIAEKINRNSLISLSAAKRAVDKASDMSLRDGIELEAELFQEVFMSEDVSEGVDAFINKRHPLFKHR